MSNDDKVWCESCQEYHDRDELIDGGRTPPIKPVAVHPDKAADGYPTKADMMESLSEGVNSMIEAGKLPKGSKLKDVRIAQVVFLIEKPDGEQVVLSAALRREEEILSNALARMGAGSDAVN